MLCLEKAVYKIPDNRKVFNLSASYDSVIGIGSTINIWLSQSSYSRQLSGTSYVYCASNLP